MEIIDRIKGDLQEIILAIVKTEMKQIVREALREMIRTDVPRKLAESDGTFIGLLLEGGQESIGSGAKYNSNVN